MQITTMIPPQMVRNYDPNCMGNYYLARNGKWMWDPNCQYKGSGPISGAELGHTTINHQGRSLADDHMFGLNQDGEPISPWSVFWWLASIAGAGTGAYHGYKRNNDSVGWAIGWFFFGGILPILSIPISLAEGFGKPKK